MLAEERGCVDDMIRRRVDRESSNFLMRRLRRAQPNGQIAAKAGGVGSQLVGSVS